jgi:hypothetical protein
MLLLALALTGLIPAVYVVLDQLLHLPNAARWIANALVLGAAYYVDTFFTALTLRQRAAQRRGRLLLGVLALTLAAMAVLLWRAHLTVELPNFTPQKRNGALVGYRLVFLAFLSFVALRTIRAANHYRRVTPARIIKMGMTVNLLGALWVLGYIATAVGVVLAPAPPVDAWFQSGVQICSVLAMLCIAVGSTLPLWGKYVPGALLLRHLRTLRTYRRLRPLWRLVTAAAPAVVLPLALPWRRALLAPRAMELLVNRQVIEILDARRLLLQPQRQNGTMGAGEASPSHRDSGAAETVGTPEERAQCVEDLHQLAQAEAQLLVSTLERWNTGATPATAPVTCYEPATYEEAVRYLVAVADALHRVRRQRNTITGANGGTYGQQRLFQKVGEAPMSALQLGWADRPASAISAVTNPGVVALPTFLVVALHTAPTIGMGLLWWLITTVGISVAPLLHVSLGVRAGRYTDQHLCLRERRLIPLLVGLAGTGAALAALALLHGSRTLLATVTAVVVGVAIALAITHGLRWKVSLHMGESPAQ